MNDASYAKPNEGQNLPDKDKEWNKEVHGCRLTVEMFRMLDGDVRARTNIDILTLSQQLLPYLPHTIVPGLRHFIYFLSEQSRKDLAS